MSHEDYPWSQLQLDPTTTTERDVKRAYARLIKIHRPDTDPDGFRAVHEAYQEALAKLNDQPPPLRPLPLIESESTATEQSSQTRQLLLPPELAALLLRFSNAMGRKDKARIDSIWQEMLLQLEGHSEFAATFDQTLLGLIAKLPSLLSLFFTPTRVIELIPIRAYQTASLILKKWHILRLSNQLGQFLKLLIAHRLADDDSASVAFQILAVDLTLFVNYAQAQKLINRLFLQLPPGTWQAISENLDRRANPAYIFSVLPLAERIYWENKVAPIHGPPQTFDAREAAIHFRKAMDVCPRSWPGWDMLSHILPSQIISENADGIRKNVMRTLFFDQTDWRNISIQDHFRNWGRDLKPPLLMALKVILAGALLLLLLGYLLKGSNPFKPPVTPSSAPKLIDRNEINSHSP